jgi:hypothetical protein
MTNVPDLGSRAARISRKTSKAAMLTGMITQVYLGLAGLMAILAFVRLRVSAFFWASTEMIAERIQANRLSSSTLIMLLHTTFATIFFIWG